MNRTSEVCFDSQFLLYFSSYCQTQPKNPALSPARAGPFGLRVQFELLASVWQGEAGTQLKAMYPARNVGISRPRNLPLQSIPRELDSICGLHRSVGGWMDRDKQTQPRRCVLNDSWLFVSQGAPVSQLFLQTPHAGAPEEQTAPSGEMAIPW